MLKITGDPLLSDLGRENLKKYTEDSGLEFLGKAPKFPGSFPAMGHVLVKMETYRPVINLPVIAVNLPHAQAITVPFIVDSGASTSFLAKETVTKLFQHSEIPEEHKVVAILTENPVSFQTAYGSQLLEGLSLLGGSFFHINELTLKIRY